MLDRRRHKIFKLKIGSGEPKQDIAHVAAIKRALGDAPACASTSTRAGARRRRPGRSPHWRTRAAISSNSRSRCPIAPAWPGSPRPLVSPSWPMRRCTARRRPSTSLRMQPPTYSPSRLRSPGGLFAAARVAAIADAAGIGLYGGTMLEGAVGTVASAHLFATFPDIEWGTELFGPLLLTEEILDRNPSTTASSVSRCRPDRVSVSRSMKTDSRPFPPRPSGSAAFTPCRTSRRDPDPSLIHRPFTTRIYT